ncbi:MAG: hypothetical protein J6R82_04330 [Clostridia bacterium]|nr:hypothetical protein [Clostridia bacterium]
MTDENKMMQAKAVFANICDSLDARSWHYDKNEEGLSIRCSVSSDDLPIELVIQVDSPRYLLMLLSKIPFTTPEDKRLDLAIAVSIVNNRLVDGCFDYDVKSGNMFFRMTNSYMDSKIGDDVFSYMILCSASTIDNYNEKFMLLAKGIITLEKFMDLLD